MKWICAYCQKVIDESNFADFIMEKESGSAATAINNNEREYHSWQRLMSKQPSNDCIFK
jgi:hypothetical protein